MILPIDADAFTSIGQYSAVVVAVLYGLYGFWGSDASPVRARLLIWVLWFLHGVSVVHSLIGDVDFTPRFGFAAALSASAWLIFSCYVLERHWFPQSRVRWVVALMGMLSVVLTLFYPGQALHLGASPLLPLHWALGMGSYGLFGAAVIHAMVLSHAERMIRQAQPVDEGLPLLTLERLTFRFVTAGFILLTATLLAGGLFGDYLYGPAHAFRLDHKTVFSFLSWLIFAMLLLGRARLGWRGQKATRVLYLGSGLLFLAYAGSRFVLEVVLHRSF